MAHFEPVELSKYGDYHAVFAWGAQRGKRINRCSMASVGWLLVYCMTVADDYLIFPADPDELRAAAAPRRPDLTDEEIVAWLDECESHRLIRRYTSGEQLWAVMMMAPPKKTKNGKHGRRFPHPPSEVARWLPDSRQWVPPGESKESKKSRTSNDNIAEQSKSEQNPPYPPRGGGGYSVDFERFWTVYPRKVGKDAAWKRWQQRKADLPPVDDLLRAIDLQKRSDSWRRDGGQYIPHPTTWLSHGRWADEVGGGKSAPTENPDLKLKRQVASIPVSERAGLIAEVQKRWPNLADLSPENRGVQGAMVRLWQERQGGSA